MSLGTFYGSLAASASVIVGILSAFLVNSLVGIRQEQRQLQREFEQVTNELEGRSAERDEYQERVHEIETAWRERDADAAHANVDKFLSENVSKDGFNDPPESVGTGQIAEEFADYLDKDSADALSDVQIDVLRQRGDGIRGELAIAAAESHLPDMHMLSAQGPSHTVENFDASLEAVINRFREHHEIDQLLPVTRNSLRSEYNEWRKEENGPDYLPNSLDSPSENRFTSPLAIPSDTGLASSNRSLAEKRERNRNRARLTEAEARVRELKERKQAVNVRLQSLSLKSVQKMLRSSAVAIVLTVVTPLLAYLCYELDIILIDMGPVIGPMSVFAIWTAGLLYVLVKLRVRIFSSTKDGVRQLALGEALPPLENLSNTNNWTRFGTNQSDRESWEGTTDSDKELTESETGTK